MLNDRSHRIAILRLLIASDWSLVKKIEPTYVCVLLIISNFLFATDTRADWSIHDASSCVAFTGAFTKRKKPNNDDADSLDRKSSWAEIAIRSSRTPSGFYRECLRFAKWRYARCNIISERCFSEENERTGSYTSEISRRSDILNKDNST